MTTLGSTSKPDNQQEFWGLNSKNQHASKLSMPSGGPWQITKLGAWLAGVGAGATCKLVLWNAGGTKLAESDAFTAAGDTFALGHSDNYEKDIPNVTVDGDDDVWVGFWRDPSDSVQFGTFASGSHKDEDQGAGPGALGGSVHDGFGKIGAYLFYSSANQAPNYPTNQEPNSGEVVNTGTSVVVSGTRDDPDAGDYITAVQVRAYESDGVTRVYDSGKDPISGKPTSFSKTISLPRANANFVWKGRTWDKEDVAGPFSPGREFYANAKPSTPSAPDVNENSLTPTIQGVFIDDGDTAAAVQIEVTLNASPYTSMWDTGDLAISGASGTAWSKTYAGVALSYGTTYRARYRVKDSHGAYSSFSNWTAFTPIAPTGPATMTPSSKNPRLASLTPTLTVGNPTAFQNDEIQVYSANSLSSTQLWYKTWDGTNYAAVTSKGRVYAGTALAYGGVYYWRARVRIAGVDGSWSALMPFRINAQPSAVGMTPTGGQALTTLTPTLSWSFDDPDLIDQGDSQTAYTIEVANNSTGTTVATLTGTTATSRVYNGAALSWETEYKWRVKLTDAMGLQGAFSAWRVFKPSQPPSATGVSPVGGASVNDRSPTVTWTFSSPGGKAQYSYQVLLYDKGPTGANFTDEVVVYDSGTIISTDLFHEIPIGYVVNNHDYRWELTVKDADGLAYTLT